jgi:exodeoxyribonuclease VIII
MSQATHKLRANMPFARYLEIPAQSVSGLKHLRRSPLHFKHARENPRPPTPAMSFGTAAHCAVLEPDRFARDFLVWDRTTDSGRSAPRNGKVWDEFLARAQAEGATVITEGEREACMRLQRAVRSDPVAAPYLERGMPEIVMQWDNDGRACKGRADWLTAMSGNACLVGLKTTRDASPRVFAATAARLGYHLQWAWYADGYERLMPDASPATVEIVVEAEAPHAVTVYVIPDDVLEQGRSEYTRLLEQLAECEREDRWPGPTETAVQFALPVWAYDGDGDDGSMGLNWEAA